MITIAYELICHDVEGKAVVVAGVGRVAMLKDLIMTARTIKLREMALRVNSETE